jgi:hypothetical protein
VDEPTNEWEFEVVRRVRAGEDEETALADVIATFLDAGKPAPLVEAIRKGLRLPVSIMRRIAAMFEEAPTANEPVQTMLRIEITRRGRPIPSDRPLSHAEQELYVKPLLAGQEALAEGRDPGRMFWAFLADGLQNGHPEDWHGPPPYSRVRIRLQFRELAHRPTDPALKINRYLLREMVYRAKKDGTVSTTEAIECVAAETGQKVRTVKRAFYRE